MSNWPWARRGPRVAGLPPSTNGASSLHLRWDVQGPFETAAVDLTIEEPPTVGRLYFWALQVDFVDSGARPGGGAHLGLQWHPGHPGSTAVNWGGYRHGGGELEGSRSTLPSAMDNENTRDFDWQAGITYRLEVDPVGTQDADRSLTAWQASVTNSDTAERTVVRNLYVPGDRINSVLVWSEVFARCDHPSVSVRWSDPVTRTRSGATTRPARAAVNYQSRADGGCANTDTSPSTDGSTAGIRQRTSCERLTAQGSVIAWP